jgi:D-alanyl-D-alanine carboxypeptidase/D-alanyl-D-alanine-endopeptidase (penicillin-binding protein 4)
MWDDEWSEFTPYLSPVTLDGGVFKVTVSRRASIEVRVQPPSESVRVEVLPGNGKLEISKIPQSNRIIVSGSIGRGKTGNETVSMWRPQDVFLERVFVALKDAGLLSIESVDRGYGTVPQNAVPLTSIRRKLDEVLAVMNKESNNLCAELLLKTIAAETSRKGRDASTEEGLEFLTRALGAAGVQPPELSLVDGSGISFYNLATPAALGKVLRYIATQPFFERYAASLAVGGNDGTLARRFTSAPDNVILGKTGTIRGVSALSGYILPKKGRRLAFVMLMQNFSGSHAPYKRVQNRIVELCRAYARAH